MCEALDMQRGRCFYCKDPLMACFATVDHRTPLSKGGTDCRENIAAACSLCNRVKADLAESWFFRLLNGKQPPRVDGREMMLIWSSRRIWTRTNKACRRLERASALPFVRHRVPEASQEQSNDRAGA